MARRVITRRSMDQQGGAVPGVGEVIGLPTGLEGVAAVAGDGGFAGDHLRFEQITLPLSTIAVSGGAEKRGRDARALPADARVSLDGLRCRVSERFWKSLFARYRFGASTFRYFRPGEVFDRICEVSRNDRLRVVVEHGGDEPLALGVSRPDHPVVSIDDVRDLADARGASASAYANGAVLCTFTPRSGQAASPIGPDAFANRFVLQVPIDGFGHSQIYIGMLRLVCSNGLVAHHRAFASEIPASRDPRHTLRRAVECFDHADGFAALRERFQAAQGTWASVREAASLQRLLGRASYASQAGRVAVLEAFDRLTGRMHEFYGLTNADTLPIRRQRLLPVKCRTYDLLNFAGEVATHLSGPTGGRALHSWVGSVLAEEFDLEGTAEHVPEFTDLFVAGRG